MSKRILKNKLNLADAQVTLPKITNLNQTCKVKSYKKHSNDVTP